MSSDVYLTKARITKRIRFAAAENGKAANTFVNKCAFVFCKQTLFVNYALIRY